MSMTKPTLFERILRVVTKHFRKYWSAVLAGLFFLYSGIIWLLSPNARLRYRVRKASWKRISSLAELLAWFKAEYKYSYDGPGGILDHDNTEFEFFIRNGDCDDMARFAMKKLLELGYKASRYVIFGNAIGAGHFDCFYELKPENRNSFKFALFNYGKPVYGNSLEDCMTTLGRNWKLFENAFYFKYND